MMMCPAGAVRPALPTVPGVRTPTTVLILKTLDWSASVGKCDNYPCMLMHYTHV